MKTHTLKIVVNGRFKNKIAYMAPGDPDKISSYRISGPKAIYRESTEITSIAISGEDLVRYIKEYATDVYEELKKDFENNKSKEDSGLFEIIHNGCEG